MYYPSKYLPLSLLAALESLQYADNILKSSQVCSQLNGDLGLVSQLGVEVPTVGAGAHGGREDGLDEEAVVGLEGLAVCVSERSGEFFGFLGQVLAQCNTREFQTSVTNTVSLQLIRAQIVPPGSSIEKSLPGEP